MKIAAGDAPGLLQLLDDSMGMLAEEDAPADTVRRLWLTVVAGLSQPQFAARHDELHGRLKTWQVCPQVQLMCILLFVIHEVPTLSMSYHIISMICEHGCLGY